MKRINLLGLFLAISSTLFSQEESQKNRSDKFAIGMKLTQVHGDFGMGLELTSPYFVYKALAVRLNTLMQFNEHYDAKTKEDTWSPYFVSRLGVIGVGGRPASFLRLYGEGGAVAGIPSSSVSNENAFFGGYGLFGFEMFMSGGGNEVASYYIELGATGTGARGDLLPRNPIYHNGFAIGTGFRIYL